MSGARHWEQDKEATVYIGNLDERVSDSLVWELMLQAGRIVNVHLPKDRVTQTHQGYGFVEFKSEEDADYAARIMNQVRMYGKPIRVNKASADKQKLLEIGAELFIGNLDPMVSEQTLYETFSRFGSLLSVPKIARDDANLSKGFGFVSFSNFEASDEAIANLNGQYLMNKEISVQYAYKKDGKGERHGDEAERMLATQAKKNMVQPTAQAMPVTLMTPATPGPGPMDAAMAAATGGRPPMGAGMPVPPPMPMFPGGAPPPMPAGFQNMGNPGVVAPPPPAGRGGGMPPQQHPLPAPPSGLPPRPPPSQAGYGGPPQGFMPPGFGGPPGPPPGFANGQPPPQMPPGFQAAGSNG